MPPRTPGLTTIALLAGTLLASPACAERKRERTEPPATEGADSSGSAGASSAGQCVAGGPSVSMNIRGRAGGDDMPNDELGTLLGWIGGFAQPCRQATPEASQFTLEIEIGAAGEKPTMVLEDREALPGLAACLDETFAKAAPPPPGGPMTVDIVIPWGCPTLGPDFQEKSAKTEAPASEPAP